jgi:hypothetical protein
MSPLALPREILHPWVDEILAQTNLATGPLHDVLVQLKTRPTFEEQFPDTYQAGLVKGKQRVLQLESIRGDTFTMADIMSQRPDTHKWWISIES